MVAAAAPCGLGTEVQLHAFDRQRERVVEMIPRYRSHSPIDADGREMQLE